jgi:hypothetical protein
VLERADTYIWLDYQRPVVMRRVIGRTARRVVFRERLFNGNREKLTAAFVDPEHPVRWAWTQHTPRRRRNVVRLSDPGHGHLTVVRLTTPAATDGWLAGIRSQSSS